MKTHCRSISRTLLAMCLLSGYVLAAPARADLIAFSDFGPGNTYGNFGSTVGGQFVNGFQFTSTATGTVSQIDVGIGGSGSFNLAMYTNNSGVLGTQIWSGASSVGAGSPNPAEINVSSGPSITLGQKYWLVASGQFSSAFWSPNTIGAVGPNYHHDNNGDQYFNNTLGAFSVSVTVPEPATFVSLLLGTIALGYLGLRRRQG